MKVTLILFKLVFVVYRTHNREFSIFRRISSLIISYHMKLCCITSFNIGHMLIYVCNKLSAKETRKYKVQLLPDTYED